MAEQKKQERKKLTPTEFAINFNSGAAYAEATGETLEGMAYVFSRSKDLRTEPIIERTMAGAQAYMKAENEYATKINEWNNSDDKTKEDMPKFNMSPEIALAQVHYQELRNSSQMRNKIFNENYEKMTVGQAQGMTLYNKLPRNIPDAIKTLIESNKDKTISGIEDRQLKGAMNAIRTYHILGNTRRNIQMMHLENTLAGLVEEDISQEISLLEEHLAQAA